MSTCRHAWELYRFLNPLNHLTMRILIFKPGKHLTKPVKLNNINRSNGNKYVIYLKKNAKKMLIRGEMT